MRYFMLAACVLVISAKQLTKYHDCGSNFGHVLSVDISPCSAEPCTLKRNSTVNMSVRFISMIDTTDVQQVTTIILSSSLSVLPSKAFELPWTALGSNACPYIDADHCHIGITDTVNYTNPVHIPSYLPAIRFTVKGALKDNQNRTIVCTLLPAEII